MKTKQIIQTLNTIKNNAGFTLSEKKQEKIINIMAMIETLQLNTAFMIYHGIRERMDSKI